VSDQRGGGGLDQAVADYLATRRALGFKLERHGRLLPDLVGAVTRAGATTLSTELVLGWATQPAGRQEACAQRLSVARGFARYLQTLDPTAEVPPADFLPRRRRRASPTCTPTPRSAGCWRPRRRSDSRSAPRPTAPCSACLR
jgi:hypothetical protein